MSEPTPHFIVVEGLTGSGKTSVADLLAVRNGFERVPITPPEFRLALSYVEEDPSMLDSRFLLYMASVLTAASKVRDLICAGKGVVVDSWWYRTVATHTALGSSLRVEVPLWLPKPTRTFLLDLPESERHARIALRGRPSGFWKSRCEECTADIRQLYSSLVSGMQIVDARPPLLNVVQTIETMLQ